MTTAWQAVEALVCAKCGSRYGKEEIEYVCPKCGPDGILDVAYDYEALARTAAPLLRIEAQQTYWRYEPLLPIPEGAPRPPAAMPWTPLYRADRLAAHLGLKTLYVKDDGRQPTASLKDRASAVALARAAAQGLRTVATASTGNAASSLAGLAAGMGLETYIFVPETAPPAKLAQLAVFGAKVLAVQGTYDDAFDLCVRACEEQGWYCRNTGYNPYMAEGKKTAALELWDQLGGRLPDWLFVSAGDGCITTGMGRALRDLKALGLADRPCRLVAVQSQGSDALFQAWRAGTEEIQPVSAHTVADSISVDKPRSGILALRAVRENEGLFVAVPDEAILEAGRLLGRLAGIFAEPAGAAPLAGLMALLEEGTVESGDTVAVLVSGNGLKDPAGASQGAPGPVSVAADGSDLDRALAALSR